MPTLDWIGKKAVVNHHRHVPFHLLKNREDLSCGDSNSGNLLVQADNLLALKALLPYYAGQVKCIYIDPPYNTGNEGWVYNDNVNSPEMKAWLGKAVGREAEDLSRHDKWLCMMYPRLQLLREFLSENGSIFISIDDVEVGNLRLMLDEIFLPTNFVANLIWQKKYSPQNDAQFFSPMHDHILAYAKNLKVWKRNLIQRTEKQDKAYKNSDDDPRGPWKASDLTRPEHRDRDFYGIKTPSGKEVFPAKGRSWSRPPDEIERLRNDNRLWFGKNGDSIPSLKRFLNEVKEGVVPTTIWLRDEVGDNQEAKQEIKDLTDGALFSTPKPVRLVQRILEIATDKDSLILDSFAGSGSTGHAVLALNKIDSGNRRFILVEMDQKICNEITAHRLSRVVQGFDPKKSLSKTRISGLGSGFSYCELGLPLFDEKGRIKSEVTFKDLARHVFFSETGKPLPDKAEKKFPLLGVSDGIALYLLYNGILKDKTPNGGNVLTVPVLQSLPAHNGPKVIYGVGCRIGAVRLSQENIIFRQIPYEIKVS